VLLVLAIALALLVALLLVWASRRGRRPAEQWIADRLECDAGARRYKLYVPPAHPDRPLPLIVMLHGCTQDAEDFAAGTRMNLLAATERFFVLYPEQSRLANPRRCWNWYRAENQRRDRGEPAIIAAIVRNVATRFPVASSSIYVAGISAGGAMALVLGAIYPDLFAAVGVHSGVPYGAGQSLYSGMLAMRGHGSDPVRSVHAIAASPNLRAVPLIVLHGGRDRVTRVANAHQIERQWNHLAATASGVDLTESAKEERAADGRNYTRTRWSANGGPALIESLIIEDLGHAWSGGDPRGSYTDPAGPRASEEMVRFFARHAVPAAILTERGTC